MPSGELTGSVAVTETPDETIVPDDRTEVCELRLPEATTAEPAEEAKVAVFAVLAVVAVSAKAAPIVCHVDPVQTFK